MNKYIAFLFLAACTSLTANAAKIECRQENIIFVGKIEAGDYQRVVACKNQLAAIEQPTKSPILAIASPGGSVSEAMKIGRYVRSNKMWVSIPSEGGVCLSSCVYILAAGVVRWPWGEVGIHRPYFETKPNQGYDASLKVLLDESRAYFREMNIPELLADDMFSIPPQAMRVLGDAALSKYRLNQTDMAFEEENANRNAAAYGITRQEYMRRLKQQERYMDDCLSTAPKPSSTLDVVRCGNWSYKKAGLIHKN